MQLPLAFPLHLEFYLNPIVLFGLILLLGLLGGELFSRSRILPKISGYITVGFLFGPGGFDVVDQSLLANARVFVDISLGLILFELGRHLDFKWLYRDRGILPMALAESGFTFILIFGVLHWIVGLPSTPSMFAATIAIATSSAVVMTIASDLSSEGPVTRRALILTSLNNFFALVIFTGLLPITQPAILPDVEPLVHTAFRLFGSLFLGLVMFGVVRLMAQLTGKHKEAQFVILAGAVVLTIGLTRALGLSTMLTLFMLGVAARNFDRKHILMEMNFGWLARLFFILLFVVTGVYLQLEGLWQAPWVILVFLIARLVAKTGGIWLFAKASRLTKQQIFAMSLTLLPMAGVAMGMSNMVSDFDPDLGSQLRIVIAAAVAILNIIGPIVTQFAFIKSGEALSISEQNTKGVG